MQHSICNTPYLQDSSQCPDAVQECLVSAIQAPVASLLTEDDDSVEQQLHMLRGQIKALLDDSQLLLVQLPGVDVGGDVALDTNDDGHDGDGDEVIQYGSIPDDTVLRYFCQTMPAHSPGLLCSQEHLCLSQWHLIQHL